MSLANSQLGLARARERRRSPREKVSAVVYLTVESYNGGIVLDLSESGMCISVANPLSRAATIQFTLGTEEHQAVEGTGRVAWLSESGRSAGVEFVHLPDDTRRRIWEWLGRENSPTKENNARQPQARRESHAAPEPKAVSAAWPKAAGAELGAEKAGTIEAVGDKPAAETRPVSSGQKQQPPSYYTLFAAPAPRPEAVPSEEPSPADEQRDAGHVLPETPLFFLPQKRELERVSPLEFAEMAQPSAGNGEKQTAADGDKEVTVLRSAIALGGESAKREEGKGRTFGRVLVAVAILAVVMALGVAGILYYPETFASLRGFMRPASSQPAREPPRAASTRRFGRRVARGLARNERGSRPVGDITTFYASRPVGPRPSAKTPNRSNQGWLPKVTSQRVASIPSEPTTTADGSGLSQSQGQMPDLRVDGALVEEGSVAPTFAPLNLDRQTPGREPIVVEAVIGKNGGVKTVRLISTRASRLAQALVDAVKRWRYRPVYQNGQPIEFTTRITFDFSVPGPDR